MSEKTLGILGGVGPLATAYFMQMIIEMDYAETDQEHIPMVITNNSKIPDRTAFIVGKSNDNPLPPMINDAKRLQSIGADVIAIPCNTAHFFYDEIQKAVDIPILNIIEETLSYASLSEHVTKIGILATSGTIASGSYQSVCKKHNIDFVLPSFDVENSLMDIIYNQIKAGKGIDYEKFANILLYMKERGCDAVILGCTELSVLNKNFKFHEINIIDSMEVLAKKCIAVCKKDERSFV